MSVTPLRRPRLGAVGALLLALAALVLGASATLAHAELVSSDPAANSTVTGPFAGPVVLTFSEPLAKGSKAELVDSAGKTVASAPIDAANNRLLTFHLGAPLEAGAYTVRWTSIADDGHVERGTLKITVAAAPTPSPTPSAPASAPPSAAPTAAPTSMPTPSPAASGDASPEGSGGTDALLPLLAAVVVVGGLGATLLRNRRPAGR